MSKYWNKKYLNDVFFTYDNVPGFLLNNIHGD